MAIKHLKPRSKKFLYKWFFKSSFSMKWLALIAILEIVLQFFFLIKNEDPSTWNKIHPFFWITWFIIICFLEKKLFWTHFYNRYDPTDPTDPTDWSFIRTYLKTRKKARYWLKWGTYGLNGNEPLKHVLLKDLTDDHIKAILRTQNHIGRFIRRRFKGELRLRKRKPHLSIKETIYDT